MSAPGTTPAHSGAILHLLDRPVTASELDAAAELAARPAQPLGARSSGLLLFRLGDETAALSAKLLRSVTRRTRPRPIPHHSAGVFRGLCNIRGELMLCADLHRLLGLPDRDAADRNQDDSSDPRRMVVIGGSDDSWVFEVDALIGIERLDSASLRPAPITVTFARGDFTSGVAEISGRPVTVLDGGRILAGFKASLR